MSSKKTVAMISVLGDNNLAVTKKLVELLEQGMFPEGVSVLHIETNRSYRKSQETPEVAEQHSIKVDQPELPRTTLAKNVTWPVVSNYCQ